MAEKLFNSQHTQTAQIGRANYSLCILMLALLLILTATANAKTNLQQQLGSVSVISYGAKADSKTDNTAAFQRALDAMSTKGGLVIVPSGTFLIKGSLTIPEGVTLQGVWQAPHNTTLGKGSFIFATGFAGDEKGTPLINLNPNSCIKGMTIFYPEQDPVNVKPYPWTIQGKGTNCSVIDVTLTNPYKGIDFGTYTNELHYIRNVYGCPIRMGVYINKCYDIGRIENVHFQSNAWTRSGFPNAPVGEKWQALKKYIHENLEAFVFGRTDWEYVSGCFTIFPHIGFRFISVENGPGNVLVSQSGSDLCETAVQVDALQSHAGVEFSNCQFMSRVIIGPGNNGPVKFTNCGFWPINQTDNQAIIEGTGTVTFTATHFAGWGAVDQQAPCIQLKSGSLIINGCEFMDKGKRQIELGANTKSAAIFGSLFHGGEKIINNAPATAKVQIGLNIEE
ncbi:MAG: glycosyl hydrolase family 28-related protein [Armatimonadota bacterium]|nr:glycoside hydrolase family 55 protein [bacterium]